MTGLPRYDPTPEAPAQEAIVGPMVAAMAEAFPVALHAAYGRFVAENPGFVALTGQRVSSYWDCYHRNVYASFAHYPARTLVRALRAAGKHAVASSPRRAPASG